jgi:hypothetical protein
MQQERKQASSDVLTCVVDQVSIGCICGDQRDQVIACSLVSAHSEEAIPCALVVLTQKPLQILEAICANKISTFYQDFWQMMESDGLKCRCLLWATPTQSSSLL